MSCTVTSLNNCAETTGKSNVTPETVYLWMFFCDILLDVRNFLTKLCIEWENRRGMMRPHKPVIGASSLGI